MIIYILSVLVIVTALMVLPCNQLFPTILAQEDSLTESITENTTNSITENTTNSITENNTESSEDENFQQSGTISRRHN